MEELNKPDLSVQELVEWGIKRPDYLTRQRMAVLEMEGEIKSEYSINNKTAARNNRK